MHGLGNDFIVIDDRAAKLKKVPALSKKICDRRFGIGADQVLLLRRSGKADFKMLVFNSDGSVVEMCGNGIRCLAKYIWDNNLAPAAKSKKSTPEILAIETLAGIICPEKSDSLIRVDMGEPVLDGKDIPVKMKGQVMDHPLKIKDRTFRISCVSMGNPHSVIVTKNIDSFPLDKYGPIIENHRLFPNRTNVEFIEVLSRSSIKMRVWERGTGETMACGTGASAVGVASFLLGITNRNVTVHLPGGKLKINWSAKDNHVYMTGPAVKVYEGVIDI